MTYHAHCKRCKLPIARNTGGLWSEDRDRTIVCYDGEKYHPEHAPAVEPSPEERHGNQCAYCQKLCPEGQAWHTSCKNFALWIDNGGTMD